VGIREDHLTRLNTLQRPIVNQYREGKVKRTPVRGVKEPETVRLQAVEGPCSSEHARPRAFCIMSRLVTLCGKAKR
jgi:hypothetical protein